MSDDDIDMDAWFAMTEAERNAELRRVEAQWNEHCDRLARQPVRVQVAVQRGSRLRSILENRRRLRDPKLARIEFIDDLFRQSIRRDQVRLVKLRIWRATGVYPGQG